MKKMISILLAFYFLLAGLMPNMDIHELGSIPDLVAHYAEHSQSDNEMGISKFITVHYGIQDQLPNDGHDLPFKNHTCGIVAHFFTTLMTPFILHFSSARINQEYRDTYILHLISQFTFSIWQPPQYS